MPGRYPFVEIPQVQVDPMRSLSQLMSLDRQFEAQRKDRAARDSEASVRKALTDAGGDLDGASALLGKQGRWEEAIHLRKQSGQIRDDLVKRIDGQIRKSASTFGQAKEAFQQVSANPSVYPNLRPVLQNFATAVDPTLTVPDAYDPDALQSLGHTITAGLQQHEMKAKALKDLKEARAASDDALARHKLHVSSLSNAFGATGSKEEWDDVAQSYRLLGVPAETISEFGPYEPSAPLKAAMRGMTSDQLGKFLDPKEATTLEARLAEAWGNPEAARAVLAQARALALARHVTDPKEAKEPKSTDDPELPRGVINYLYSLPRTAGTWEQAQKELAATMPQLQADHPSLNPIKAEAELRKLFRPLISPYEQAMLDLDKPASTPGTGNAPTTPATAPPRQPAAPTTARSNEPRVGSVVVYQGKRYRVAGIANGQAQLKPVN